ncbi:MAG: ribosome recycling factor [Clostridia bacterium]|nr:MAG: ribosome recycling factor [Clostridia bacterium]
MYDEVVKKAEQNMGKSVENLQNELAALRAGRANPGLLAKVQVDYYGVSTPLNQVANISAPEARLLLVQPWDRAMLPQIEKAILKSDLGLVPSSDGAVVRIAIPPLTEERRKEIIKVARKKAEEARVAVRNVRREANDEAKTREKEKGGSEDETRRTLDEVQKMTDKFIKKIDETLALKEQEIMEV